MIRVVFDTNVYVSAFEFGGKPRELLLLAAAGFFRLFISPAILEELLEVLRVGFQYENERCFQLEGRLAAMAEVVEPACEISACSDPDDNKILECAVAAAATHLITGDKHLLQMISFEEVQIVTPAQFRELYRLTLAEEDLE